MNMVLYDGVSPIVWTDGEKTREEMDGDLHYPPVDQPCVLMEEDGVAHDWRYLKAVCEEQGVEFVDGLDDYQETFEAVMKELETPDPTVKSVDAKATAAGKAADEAKAEAAEAKAAADAASEAANPQVSAFAAMVMPTFTPTVSDSRIAEVNTLLPDFVSEGYEYKKGQCFNYEGRTWRVSSDHTSQSQCKPGDVGTESLYYEIVIAPDGIIVWAQPRGDFDAPDKGNLRHFPDADGPVYRSLVDGNAYSPEAYPQNWEKA